MLKAMKINRKVASERAMAKAHGFAWCLSSLVVLPHQTVYSILSFLFLQVKPRLKSQLKLIPTLLTLFLIFLSLAFQPQILQTFNECVVLTASQDVQVMLLEKQPGVNLCKMSGNFLHHASPAFHHCPVSLVLEGAVLK